MSIERWEQYSVELGIIAFGVVFVAALFLVLKNRPDARRKALVAGSVVLFVGVVILAFLEVPMLIRGAGDSGGPTVSKSGNGHTTNSGNVGSSGEAPIYSPERVEAAWRLLGWGSVAFSSPQKIALERTEKVAATVSPKLSPKELEEILEDQLAPRKPVGKRIKISNRMRAELIGPAFTIVPIVPEEQAIRNDEPTNWSWMVTPTQSGDQSLHLIIYAILNVPDLWGGKDVKIVLKTYEKTIAIEVSVIQRVSIFFREHWQWAFASLLIPVAKFVVGRRSSAGGSPKPPGLRFIQRMRRRRGLM